jgi:hypothetical protein
MMAGRLFVIDTGAARTLLHPSDAMAAFGVQLAHLADPQQWRST